MHDFDVADKKSEYLSELKSIRDNNIKISIRNIILLQLTTLCNSEYIHSMF